MLSASLVRALAWAAIGSPDSWYGSDAVVDDWLPQAQKAVAKGGGGLSGFQQIKKFGAAGTLAVAQLLTRLFKSFGTAQGGKVDLIDFSGFMLACLEDAGLADAAAKGHFSITGLNAYSAVCGIGLDTYDAAYYAQTWTSRSAKMLLTRLQPLWTSKTIAFKFVFLESEANPRSCFTKTLNKRSARPMI